MRNEGERTTPGLPGNRDPLDGKMISPLVSKVKRFRKWLIAFKKSDGAGMVAFLVARNHSQPRARPPKLPIRLTSATRNWQNRYLSEGRQSWQEKRCPTVESRSPVPRPSSQSSGLLKRKPPA